MLTEAQVVPLTSVNVQPAQLELRGFVRCWRILRFWATPCPRRRSGERPTSMSTAASMLTTMASCPSTAQAGWPSCSQRVLQGQLKKLGTESTKSTGAFAGELPIATY